MENSERQTSVPVPGAKGWGGAAMMNKVGRGPFLCSGHEAPSVTAAVPTCLVLHSNACNAFWAVETFGLGKN